MSGIATITNIVRKNEVNMDLYHFAVRLKNDENDNIDWRHVRKIKPRPEHLDFDSDDESETIVNSSIENSDVKPASDSSTGGGVTKVHKSDLER